MTTPIDHPDLPVAVYLIVLRGDSTRSSAYAPLLLELMARCPRVAVVDDAPSVMVELHRGGQAVVLMDDPAAAAELITAATRYYPRVSLWRAAPDPHRGRPGLARIVSAASVSAASHRADDPSPHRPDEAPGRPPVTVGTAAVVSDEELAMLMSPLEGS